MVIDGCTVRDNTADRDYGGALVTGAAVLNTRFFRNSAEDDVGALAVSEGTIVRGCVFQSNSAEDAVGALSIGYTYGTQCTYIDNCTFLDNSADTYPGTAAINRGIARFANCVFWSTTAAAGEHIRMGSATVTISHCDIQGGIAGINADPGGTLVWGDGNIDADPLLALGRPDYGRGASPARVAMPRRG